MLQIASIEVYFFGFFFGVCSTFKGRFRSILATISDQSCLNMIAIELERGGGGGGGSRRTYDFTLKMLIFSCFNQKLSYKERRTSIYRKINAKNAGHPIS